MFRKLILSAVMATGTVTGLALTPTAAEANSPVGYHQHRKRPADHVIDAFGIVVGTYFSPWRMPSCPSRPHARILTRPPPRSGPNASTASVRASTRSLSSVPPRASRSPTSTSGVVASSRLSRPQPARHPSSCLCGSHLHLRPRPSQRRHLSSWSSHPGPSSASRDQPHQR